MRPKGESLEPHGLTTAFYTLNKAAFDPSLHHQTLTGAFSQGRHSTGPERDLLRLSVSRPVTRPQPHCVVLGGMELPILLPLWPACCDYKPATGFGDAGKGSRILCQGIHSTNGLHLHVVLSLRKGQAQRSVLPHPSLPPSFWGLLVESWASVHTCCSPQHLYLLFSF